MSISLANIITWLILGAIAGTLAGMVVKGQKTGFGFWTNFGIGLVGAIIGLGLFHFLPINLGLGDVQVSLEDILAAFLGALLFLGALWFWRKRRK